MFKIVSFGLYFTNVYSQLVGGTRDNNDCLISAGYSWCESSSSCIRSWETPCEDNFISCGDCLKKQRRGMNIACPIRCDVKGPISIPLPETPISPSIPPPMPPHILLDNPISDTSVINPFLNTCSHVQMAVYHGCNSDCHNCDFKDTRTVLSDCINNGVRASNDLCQGDIHSCSIPYNDCNNEYVCPKITEITDCGSNGLNGYSTYRLSLIVKNPDVKNIYAIYGDDEDLSRPMIIPPAYQSIINFNSNIGGVLPAIINIDPDSQYDSWLTIGITDGNTGNQVSTVGIDFSTWTENTGIHTTNGAVFTIDPEVSVVDGDEYVVAQITVPNTRSVELTLNAQGKTNCDNNCNMDNRAWKQEGVVFNIEPPTRDNHNNIPHSCSAWFDGCNTCQVRDGQLGACTRVMCFRMDTPYCKVFDTSGH
tara:strand:- start:90 stop:1355 length:1266 start_codon:yes stop_codon:yes gene_type:complete